jgi:hypothetical protein
MRLVRSGKPQNWTNILSLRNEGVKLLARARGSREYAAGSIWKSIVAQHVL